MFQYSGRVWAGAPVGGGGEGSSPVERESPRFVMNVYATIARAATEAVTTAPDRPPWGAGRR